MLYTCENCKYKNKCENENGKERPDGDDYRALIGSHFCRRSWDQFVEHMEKEHTKND